MRKKNIRRTDIEKDTFRQMFSVKNTQCDGKEYFKRVITLKTSIESIFYLLFYVTNQIICMRHKEKWEKPVACTNYLNLANPLYDSASSSTNNIIKL